MSMICSLREVTDSDIADLLQEPTQIYDFLEKEVAEIDLDQSWHGIHFLLTGSSWEGMEPLCYLVTGGEEIGEEDVGYGPARALSSDLAANFDAALHDVSTEYLRSKFDPAAMKQAEIYPDIWDSDPRDDDALGYLIEYFEELKAFVEKVVQQQKGLLVYIV